MKLPQKARLAIVGIGNTIVGDDGAGIAVASKLQERWANDPRLAFLFLEGDLYEISDYLDRAEQYLFVDAVAGSEVGKIVRSCNIPRAYAPSFHLTDIGAVMRCMETLQVADPFPRWELWGIIIDPPQEVSNSLSLPVAEAVEQLVETLDDVIDESLALESA